MSNELKRLTVVNEPLKLYSIEGILSDNNINYVLKDIGSGDYLRIISGWSYFGVEVYVSEEQFEEAMELLEVISPGEIEEE